MISTLVEIIGITETWVDTADRDFEGKYCLHGYSLFHQDCGQACGVGVGGIACFQLVSESVFKTAGVGVGFLKLSESVFQNCWSRSQESESEHLLQLPTPMFIK